MGSLQTRPRTAIALLAGLLLALTSIAAPAEALTARAASLNVSPTLQYAGSPVTFSGNVSKSGEGAVVKIQRKSGASWVAAGQTATTTAGGAYSIALKLPATPGTYSFRTLAPKTATYAGVYSPVRSVTALRKTTATISATPSTIPLGSSSTVAGTVSPFTPSTVVALQVLTSGTWVTQTNVTLNGSGAYSTTVSPTVSTTYRVAVSRSGLNAGTQSASATVTVGAAASPPEITSPTTLPEGDKGVAYSTTLTKAGGAGTWTITAGALPAGITLAGATGVLSGTPTAGGTTSFTVKFTETATNLSDSQATTLFVSPPPTISTSTLPDVTRGVAYSTTLDKTGRAGTWTIAGLPTGLTIDTATGEISGTTTAPAGTYGVYPVFTETSTGRQAFKPLALTLVGDVAPPGSPAITTTSVPDADKGIAYSTTLTKTGEAGTWSIISGALPAGITLTGATGVLSGTPTAAGTVNFTAKFTETSSGLTATKALTLLVTPLPTVTTTTLPDATRSVAYSTTLEHTGKAGTWEIAGLPAGLTLDAATGVISGTTTAAAGTYGVFPTFTETSTGRQANAALALDVIEGTPSDTVSITTTSVPDADKGVAYSTTLTKTGGAGTWSIISGALPAGITLTGATGVLSGTPTAAGTVNFTAKFTETSSGLIATKALTLLVTPAPTITTTSLPDATRGVAYSATLEHTGKAGTWEVTGLPAGLSVNAATGVISGTTAGPAGTYGVYPTYTETSTGRTTATALALDVVPFDPVITTTSVPVGITGTAYSKQLEKTGNAGAWTLKQGTLPAGITLSSDGLLSGTPTAVGDYGFTVTFTETATGYFDNQPYLLHVEAPDSPQITSPALLPDATEGTPYAYTLDGDGTGTWAGIYGILPPGITLNGATGELSGTPTNPGDYLFILKYTTATGSNTRVFSIHVDPEPAPPAG